MSHFLLAIALAAFVVPAIAEADSPSLARLPSDGAAAGLSSWETAAIVSKIPPGIAATGTRRMDFVGAVVTPAGGAHPDRPVVSRQTVQQTIHATDFRVLEIVYR